MTSAVTHLHPCRSFSFSAKVATAILCVLLSGCSSPHFVKLDPLGNVDPSANPETSKRDLAECQAMGTGQVASCMRGKGYLKT
jgi:hypothetical protein